jgi:arginine repressor
MKKQEFIFYAGGEQTRQITVKGKSRDLARLKAIKIAIKKGTYSFEQAERYYQNEPIITNKP